MASCHGFLDRARQGEGVYWASYRRPTPSYTRCRIDQAADFSLGKSITIWRRQFFVDHSPCLLLPDAAMYEGKTLHLCIHIFEAKAVNRILSRPAEIP
jgi:hypothetical protein